MMASTQKKIAAINDLSGYGRCALTVSIPVISHMKIQCCPIPTSILSNHTGYDEYFFDDYSDRLPDYIHMWKKLDLKFDGIMSGFLGSKAQIAIVEEFIKQFSTDATQIVIDPVMGDHGKIADTYTEEMCMEMRRLVSLADIITPNLTEACRLTDVPYKETGWKRMELLSMARKLNDMGPNKVVITGIIQGQFLANYVYEKDESPQMIRTHRVGDERCGTGDLFAAIIAADAVNGVPFRQSVKKASSFVRKSMIKSIEMGIDRKNGVCFEEILHILRV
ncbi:MAG: pyridoxamine kinase [Lachnospiraceae bacterium]|nr:pyridoxamine kinase [Lachnospiraceae bacterium]